LGLLLGLDDASREALFAHCVSPSLNAVVELWNKRPRALAHVEQLAGLLTRTWTRLAGRQPVEFLGRLTKARILLAVREAPWEDSAQLIHHLKKDIMAREAARLLTGWNWLPEPLRNMGDETTAIAAEAEIAVYPEESAVDLPAFLAADADPASAQSASGDDEVGNRLEAPRLGVPSALHWTPAIPPGLFLS
jgi:ParB family chromosome partitioning protein